MPQWPTARCGCLTFSYPNLEPKAIRVGQEYGKSAMTKAPMMKRQHPPRNVGHEHVEKIAIDIVIID